MLDTIAENQPDRRPEIIICVYEADDPAWRVLDAAGDDWTPSGARARAVGPADPTILAGVITGELDDADCRAVLLVGRTRKSDSFRLQMRAENKSLNGRSKLSRTGPAMARSTAPIAEMVRALNDAGLVAEATSDSEEDAGSYLLYRILTALPDNADAPAVGLLRIPADVDQARLETGVRAATAAIARHLAPLPRARLS